jgi:hypothetical protein
MLLNFDVDILSPHRGRGLLLIKGLVLPGGKILNQ